MQPLVTEFEDRTFRYAQMERQGTVAIFTQTHKLGGGVRYEVVRIRVAPAHTWPNGTTSPEREVYPGSYAWGREGWTFHRLPAAQGKLRELVQEHSQGASGDKAPGEPPTSPTEASGEAGSAELFPQERRAEEYGNA